MEKIPGDRDRDRDRDHDHDCVEEQDGPLESSFRAGERSEQHKGRNESDDVIDVECKEKEKQSGNDMEAEAEAEQHQLAKLKRGRPHEKGLISGVSDVDVTFQNDAANISSEVDEPFCGFQQDTAGDAFDSSVDKVTGEQEVNEMLLHGFSQPSGKIDVSHALAGSESNESKEGNASPIGVQTEAVNAGGEVQNFEVVMESAKEESESELHYDNGLVNSATMKTAQGRAIDAPSLEHPDKVEHVSRGNIIVDETSLAQERIGGVSLSREVSGIIEKCPPSIESELSEREDLQEHQIGQDLEGEDTISIKIGDEFMEPSEPVGGGDFGPPLFNQECVTHIPQICVEQHCNNDTGAKECHSAATDVVEVHHYLSLAKKGSKKSVSDIVEGVNVCPSDISIPSLKRDQSCNHGSLVAGDPTSSDDPQDEFCMDALPIPLLNEKKYEEHFECKLETDNNEKFSAENLSTEQKTVTSLAAAIQPRVDALTVAEEEGTSEEVNIAQEEDDITLKGLMQTKGRKYSEQLRPTVSFNSEIEKMESVQCEASAFMKADTSLNHDEQLKLEKQLVGAVASTHQFHEANSTGTKELIYQPEEKKNMQTHSLTSLSSHITKKHRCRMSSNENSDNCPSEYKFSVGDLVWGKVRSHPWWPGQIFDPSDASESASKYFQKVRKDRLLVAFFGDGTFGWCDESQLVPFQSYFSEKAKQTTAKAFHNAVMNALDELARRVELGLTCSCQVEEARHALKSNAMFNAGIREGAVVNDHRDIVHAVNTFDPLKFLSTIQNFAKSPHMERDLEITVASAQASSFLTFKGLIVSGKISFQTSLKQTVSVDKQGSAELGPSRQGCCGSSGKHKRKTEEKYPRRTKKRKINELIAECEPSHETGKNMNGDDETLLEMAGRIKKRKINEVVADHEPPSDGAEGDGAEEDSSGRDETLLDIAVTGSEVANTGNTAVKKVKSDVAKSKREASLPRRESSVKTKKHQKPESFDIDVLNDDLNDLRSKEELASTNPGVDPDGKGTLKTFGECIRKVASELTSTSPDSKVISVANAQKSWERGNKLARKLRANVCSSPSIKKDTTRPLQENSSTRELLSELLIVAENPLYWARKKKMPFKLIHAFLQFRNAVFEKSSTNSDVTKSSVSTFANEPKSQISSIFPGSSDVAESKDIDWPTSHVRQTKLKRKTELFFEGARKKTKHNIRLPSPPWSKKSLKNEQEDKTGDRYAKQYSRRLLVPHSSPASLTEFAADSNTSQKPAALFMRFPKGFALPSEIELKAKFARFGPLEISETKVFRRSGCAQVVFKTLSAAEAAFNFASENNVFGSARVSFRLRYPSSGTQEDTVQMKDHVRREKCIQQDDRQSPLKDTLRDDDGHQETKLQPADSNALSMEKGATCRPNTSGEPQLLLIQQNLEMLTSMLSRTDCTSTSTTAPSDNIPPDSKRDIMDEMMSLLQKVSALVSSPP